MAITTVLLSDTIDQFKTKTNTISGDVGDLSTLTTPITSDLVAIVNALDSDLDALGNVVSGVDALTLQGQDGNFYLNYNNFTNIPATFDSDLSLKSTTDLSEGANLYYTVTRANSAIDARVNKAFVDALNVDADTLDTQNGLYYLDYGNFTNTPNILDSADVTSIHNSLEYTGFDSDFALKTTTDLTEGTNLYYTEARVDANTNVAANTAARHTHANKAILDQIEQPFTNVDNAKLDGIDSGANLYTHPATHDWSIIQNTPTTLAGYGITDGYDSADWETHWGIKTTADLPENTNLYYTEGRVSANTDVAANTAARHTHANKATLDLIEQPFTNVDNNKLDNIDSGANLYVHPVDHPWSFITSTPTTIAGYGITDAYDSATFNAMFDANSTSDLSEGSNLYYTTARADSAIDDRVTQAFVNALNVDADTLDNQDGTYYLDYTNFTSTPNVLDSADVASIANDLEIVYSGFDSDFASKSTTDLTEGSNLYYTEGRVSANTDVAANTAARHTHANKAILDQIEQPFTNVDNAKLDGIDSGANLYVHPATHDWSIIENTPTTLAGYGITDNLFDSADFDTEFAGKSTTDLSEGSNLYYTTARADSDARYAISASGDLSYDPVTGVVSYTEPVTSTYDSADWETHWGIKTTADLPENTNLYYTTARANSDIDARVTQAFVNALNVDADTLDNQDGTYYLDYANFTGTPPSTTDSASVQGQIDSDFALRTTTDLSEGTNLYYTEVRVSANTDVAANTTARHTHANKAILDQIEQPFTNVDNDKLDNIDSGANLYVLPAATASLGGVVTGTDITIDGSGNVSVNDNSHNHQWSNITSTPTTIAGYGISDAYDSFDFDTDFGSKSTTDLSEGTNLYYTTARADSDAKNAISVTDTGGDGSLSYDNGTGVITYTGPSATEVRAHFSGGTGVDITTGTISIGQPVGTLDSVTFGGLHVTGNLVVSGTTTSINTETLVVDDNIIVLNNNVTGAPTENSGIEIERGTSDNRTLLWDETADKWTVGAETFVATTFEGALTGNVSGTVSDISNHSTSDLSEGTNLYYTVARADSDARYAISAGGDLSYNPATGIISYTDAGGGGGATVVTSNTAPLDPDSAQLWWDTEVGELRIYYVDSDTSQWVDASSKLGPQGIQGIQGAPSPKTITIINPTASEDITLMRTDQILTISQFDTLLQVSGASTLDYTVRYGTDRTGAGTEVVTGGSTTSSSTTGDEVTSFTQATIPTGNWIWIETTNITGSVQEFNLTIHFE